VPNSPCCEISSRGRGRSQPFDATRRGLARCRVKYSEISNDLSRSCWSTGGDAARMQFAVFIRKTRILISRWDIHGDFWMAELPEPSGTIPL